MFVKVNNKEYAIKFRHDRKPFKNKHVSTVKDETCCIIESEKIVLSESTISKHFKDPNNRKVARKKSLSNALSKLNLSKNERTEFWNQVWNQMKR